MPGIVAALASLNNLTAPPSDVCNGVANCEVNAAATSIRATCQSTSHHHPPIYNGSDPDGGTISDENYSSSYNPQVYVTLTTGSDDVYASFTTGPQSCETRSSPCPPGSFAIIFGAFVNTSSYLNTVDCLLTLGAINITQSDNNAPALVPNSFVQSTISGIDGRIIELYRMYTESPVSSPYNFSGAAGIPDGGDTLYVSPLGTLLISPKANSSGQQVAERIESIWEQATLLAFARSPQSANATLVSTTTTSVYVYDQLVLLILLMPLLAIIFGALGRCRIEGQDIFVGYNPAKIARRKVQIQEHIYQEPEEIREENSIATANGQGSHLLLIPKGE